MRGIWFLTMLYLVLGGLAATRIKYMIKGKKIVAKVKDNFFDSRTKGYSPIVEFVYNGEMISMRGRLTNKKPKYRIGQEVNIYYIPEQENDIYVIEKYWLIEMILMLLACIGYTIAYLC